MFHGLAVGWADVVLPGTSYLERDGSYVNLEGRVQRLRRAVIPPVPDELAWLANLAERFGVELSPHASLVFAEVSERVYGGLAFGQVGERGLRRGDGDEQPQRSRIAQRGSRPASRSASCRRSRSPSWARPAGASVRVWVAQS